MTEAKYPDLAFERKIEELKQRTSVGEDDLIFTKLSDYEINDSTKCKIKEF